MRCPNCKTELKQDDVYCYQCGTKINWFWRFKTHLIAVAVVVIVAAVLIMVLDAVFGFGLSLLLQNV